MTRLTKALALACVVATMSPASHAQEPGLVGFKSPTGNIQCQLDDYGVAEGREMSIRCDLMAMDNTPPRAPADCDLEWGRSYSISQSGTSGEFLCVGDSVNTGSWLTLAYGDTWSQFGLTCRSQESGMTCTNAQGHGFSISRSAQKVF